MQKLSDMANVFNGFLSPLIALLASLLVYWAFREQVKANKGMMVIQQASNAVEQTRQFVEYLQAAFMRMGSSQQESANVIQSKFSMIHNLVKLDPDMLAAIRSIVNAQNKADVPFTGVQAACALLSLEDDELQKVLNDFSGFFLRRNGELLRLLKVMAALDVNNLAPFQLALIHDAMGDGFYSSASGSGELHSFLRKFEYPHSDSWLPAIKRRVEHHQELCEQIKNKLSGLWTLAYEWQTLTKEESLHVLHAYAQLPNDDE